MSNELNVANCPKCGKIFQRNIRNLCQSCSTEEDTHLKVLEQQLLRNRQLSNAELSSKVAIPEDKIRYLIRSGKLRLHDYPNLADSCDNCEAPIRKGTLCLSCSTKIQNDIEYAIEQDRLLKERIKANTYISRDSQ
ncbi:MAG: hypothetical protein P0Y55_10125 [Candidatus Cohnella colombiensis]|uniref:Flagellar protein n=1 Tax=Candidatus Cohnella colombiensis TaxID=3121368 RepID=A0AA95F1H7_9BACL|nr:MAG: hypothetical protein P0Y55_10125 [Cohnella sp.]